MNPYMNSYETRHCSCFKTMPWSPSALRKSSWRAANRFVPNAQLVKIKKEVTNKESSHPGTCLLCSWMVPKSVPKVLYGSIQKGGERKQTSRVSVDIHPIRTIVLSLMCIHIYYVYIIPSTSNRP